MTVQFNRLFQFIVNTCKQYMIDESHGLKHSMDVFKYSQRIMNSEVIRTPTLINHKRIIYTTALLHDMCDKKYMDETVGLKRITDFLSTELNYNFSEIEVISRIISTMSYSKVKVSGFPEMKEYQLVYHIIREADLLTAYDIDRCIVFNMNKSDADYTTSVVDACKLYQHRMRKHIDDKLFVTETGLMIAKSLELDSLERLSELESLLTDEI